MTSTELPPPCREGHDCVGRRIHRVYRGRRYCHTCYVRLFKRSLCPGCGNFGRIHIDEKDARCLSCETKAPCVRCTDIGKPVGLMTKNGPACTGCAPYYRTPEPCECCGELSNRLNRILKMDRSLRCCPRCAREDAATCPSCRRHRFLVLGVDGQMRCKLCTEKGEIPCLICARPMPAGRGQQCDDCYWEEAFARRSRIHVQGYENACVRERFSEFCGWLNTQMGAHKAAIKLEHYLPFFSFLDTSPAELPSYVTLLDHFNADGLRRMQTPMLWLKERFGIQPDDRLREEHSDKRRIQELLDSVPAGVAATALLGYRAYLMERQHKGITTIRSVRGSMRAAQSLLVTASESFDALPTQHAVIAYLTHTPGQKAVVQGFVGYLNRTYGLSLNMEVSEHAQSKARKKALEAELQALYASNDDSDTFMRDWIKTALMLFHGLSRVSKKALTFSPFSVLGEAGYNVSLKDKTYWIPGPDKLPSLDRSSF
jgi:hypothetical protein